MRTRIGAAATALALAATIPLSAAVAAQDDGVTLTLLHNNDGESSLAPLGYGVAEDVTLEVGGAPAFKAVTEREITDARSAGNSVVNVYAGDSFLASAVLACSSPEDAESTAPVYDAIAQSQIPYDVHIFGNHEFDYGPDFLARYIAAFGSEEMALDQPFISANLDFSGEAAFADWIDEDGLIETPVADGRVIGGTVIVTDEETGEQFGVVSATYDRLPIISSPRDVAVSEAVPAIQAGVDALTAAGVDKIIFVSHLQGIDADSEALAQLSGIDIAVAGGGDELLVNDEAQLLPGEDPEDIYGTYPQYVTDADGNEVPIVTTAGNYKYVGRLDATFDAEGNLTGVVAESSYPRRVIPLEQTETGLLDELGVTDAVEGDPGIVETVLAPVGDCLDELAATPVAISEVVLNVDRGQYSAEEGVFSPGVRASQTNGGTIIADAFTASYDAYAGNVGLEPRSADNLVVTLQNGGGIRQNAGPVLPVGGTAGDAITRLNTIDVLPFLNYVVVVQDLSAEDFAATLQIACENRGGGGFMQASGVSYTCDYTGESVALRDAVIDAGDGTTVTVVDAEGVVDTSVGPVDVITNSFTAGGGDGYEAFAAAENVTLRADDDAQITYERAFREYLESFPAGEDGVPVIGADDPAYAEELGDGRITLIDG
ncbi:MAG: 5'-nucleotidase C-terminal domain-containing protein [Chloroflexota bacterium]|jgi:5'-nucleotidase